MPREQPTGLRRLRRHIHERRRWVALLLACAIGEAFAQSGSWLLVREAINEGIVPRDEQVLALATAAYVRCRVTGFALFSVVIRGMARFGQEIVLGLRRELFDHLTSLSLRYFSEQRAGWIIARLTSDVDAISDVLSQGLPTLVTNAVLLPAAITALFINDWRLGMIALVVLPPALVITRRFQRRSAAAQLEVRNRIAAVTAQIAESVAGMAVVQSFRRERAVPGALRRAQRREPRGELRRPADLVDVLPLDRVPRRGGDDRGARARRRRAAGQRDRHARRGVLPARPGVPAAAGALRPLLASCSRRPRR